MTKTKTPNTTKSNIFNNAVTSCHVDTHTDPVSCSADFPVSKADLDQAPKGVDPIVWAQAEATGGCRKRVQDDAQKVAPCECRYDHDSKTMHCHCYDPESLNPPKPHRPDF
jgi:hypothetical protein